jgi:hypothetical protein
MLGVLNLIHSFSSHIPWFHANTRSEKPRMIFFPVQRVLVLWHPILIPGSIPYEGKGRFVVIKISSQQFRFFTRQMAKMPSDYEYCEFINHDYELCISNPVFISKFLSIDSDLEYGVVTLCFKHKNGKISHQKRAFMYITLSQIKMFQSQITQDSYITYDEMVVSISAL